VSQINFKVSLNERGADESVCGKDGVSEKEAIPALGENMEPEELHDTRAYVHSYILDFK
jgi:hypothetical protein